MLVLHVTTDPTSLVGFLSGRAGYFRERGFPSSAASSPGELLDRFAKQESVLVHPVPMEREISPLRDCLSLLKMWRLLRQLSPTILHAHTPKASLLSLIAGWLAGIPVRIYHVHGLRLATATGWKARVLWLTEWISCALAHEVLCVSRSLQDMVVAKGLCPPNKTAVLAHGSINGVDAEGRFNPSRHDDTTRTTVRIQCGFPEDALVIGFVGRIVRDKGIAELVEAWQTIRERFSAARLLIIGEREAGDPISATTDIALCEDPRVHETGLVWNTEDYYSAMDLLVLPSYREGLPFTPLEAASMGLPVVATRIAGCVDAVDDGITGTLVPAHDAVALTDAIQAYLANPSLRRKHGQAGRERMLRDFRCETVWEATCSEYTRLLQTKGLPLPKPTSTVDECGEHSLQVEGG